MADKPCSYCNSSDAVQAYADGSYCFSCHKKTFIKDRLMGNLSEKHIQVCDNLEIPYPTARNKVTCRHNKECLFLGYEEKAKQYAQIVGDFGTYIHHVDLYSKNKDKWYTINNCIELPIHNLKGEYIGSEYRLFSGDRKSISDYPSGSIFLSNPLAYVESRVVTEDIASAINVSNICPSLALMGTSLPKRVSLKLLDILESADRFIIWLDGDKPGQEAAKKIKKTIEQFKPCSNIVTSLDPKYYTHSEVRDILRGHI